MALGIQGAGSQMVIEVTGGPYHITKQALNLSSYRDTLRFEVANEDT